MPKFAKISGDPQGTTERLKQFIVTKSIALEYDDRIRPAHGLSSGGKITIAESLAYVHRTAAEILKAILPEDPATFSSL